MMPFDHLAFVGADDDGGIVVGVVVITAASVPVVVMTAVVITAKLGVPTCIFDVVPLAPSP